MKHRFAMLLCRILFKMNITAVINLKVAMEITGGVGSIIILSKSDSGTLKKLEEK